MNGQGSSRTLLVVRVLVLLVAAAALVPIYMVTGAAAFTLIEKIEPLLKEFDKEMAGFEGQLKVLEARALGDGSVRPAQRGSARPVTPGQDKAFPKGGGVHATAGRSRQSRSSDPRIADHCGEDAAQGWGTGEGIRGE